MRIFLLIISFIITSSSAQANLQYESLSENGLPTVLLIKGTFEHNDDLSFFLKAVQKQNTEIIIFNSSGGNVYKAIELGKIIRTLKLHTIQLRGMECSSACSLAFLGGVIRFAEAGSIGVHKSSFINASGMDANTAISNIQKITADIMGYMTEMGVDANLLQLALQYDSNDMRYLSLREMESFNVITTQQTERPSSLPQIAATPSTTANTSSMYSTPPQTNHKPAYSPNLSIPAARSGIIHHPKKKAAIKFDPDNKSRTLIELRNGATVYLQPYDKQWYKVVYGDYMGYMHHSWVHVDQYELPKSEKRYIQISSFDNYADALEYINKSNLNLDIYLSTNGWLAVTLSETFSHSDAIKVLNNLKSRRIIPQDSRFSYGNTYVRKL
ncbi:SH3 domain-containing protein [Pseudochrobactrum sp. HB0163]|uniref:SH3 domain-containing protein n=1 Tax=Pseudochrobactrum sp. HB0163 TaxID=3450708 RepID=UPI003F6DEED4